MAIDLIADYFGFRENNTNLRIETLAGVTTFMTMSYIILCSTGSTGCCGDGQRDRDGAHLYCECPVNDFDGATGKLSHCVSAGYGS